MSIQILPATAIGRNQPRISPDGRQIVAGNGDCFVTDARTGAEIAIARPDPTRSLYDLGWARDPVTLADVLHAMSFVSLTDGIFYSGPADGSGPMTAIGEGPWPGNQMGEADGDWSSLGPAGLIIDGKPYARAEQGSGWTQDGKYAAYQRQDFRVIVVEHVTDGSHWEIVPPAGPYIDNGYSIFDVDDGCVVTFTAGGRTWLWDSRTTACTDLTLAALGPGAESEAQYLVVNGVPWICTWNKSMTCYLRPLGSETCIALDNMPGENLALGFDIELQRFVIAGNDQPFRLYRALVDLDTPLGEIVVPIDPATVVDVPAALAMIDANPLKSAAYQACFNSLMVGAPGASVRPERYYDDGCNTLIIYGGTKWSDVVATLAPDRLKTIKIICGVGPEALTIPAANLVALFGSLEGGAGATGGDSDATLAAALGAVAQAQQLGVPVVINLDGSWLDFPKLIAGLASTGRVVPMIECYQVSGLSEDDSAARWADELAALEAAGFPCYAFAYEAYIQAGSGYPIAKIVRLFPRGRALAATLPVGKVFVEAPEAELRPGGILDDASQLLPLVAAMQATNGAGAFPIINGSTARPTSPVREDDDMANLSTRVVFAGEVDAAIECVNDKDPVNTKIQALARQVGDAKYIPKGETWTPQGELLVILKQRWPDLTIADCQNADGSPKTVAEIVLAKGNQ